MLLSRPSVGLLVNILDNREYYRDAMDSEVVIESWTELMQEIYSGSWDGRLQRHRPRHAFRGKACSDDSLEPGLHLVGKHFPHVETLLLSDFRQYARFDAPIGDSLWNWLAVAQHFGLPTRLLDWTYSPFVALHFATLDVGTERPVTDGVVWRVNYGETNKQLPNSLWKTLEGYRKSVFSVDILDETVPTLAQFDALQPKEFVIFLEPPSLDERIVNQVALFSVMSRPPCKDQEAPQVRNLLDVLDRMQSEHDPDAPALYKKIVIPARLKWEVRDKLDQANINERVLFPGLDGLSAWLRRHYAGR